LKTDLTTNSYVENLRNEIMEKVKYLNEINNLNQNKKKKFSLEKRRN
jgi:hypothetical protein